MSPTMRNRLCTGVTLSLLAVATATAQIAVNPRVDMSVRQDGRLLDANPALYGGSSNYARPSSPLMSGNPYAAGIIRGGMSLQSYSPIPDVNSFRASLGSSSLYAFQRDSVSVADQSLTLSARLHGTYYDNASTAPTVGFLQNLPNANTPGTTPFNYGNISNLNYANPLAANITGLSTAYQPAAATQSSIFGTPTLQAAPQIGLPTQMNIAEPWRPLQPETPTRDENWWAPLEAIQDRQMADNTATRQPTTPVDEQTLMNSPLDSVLREQPYVDTSHLLAGNNQATTPTWPGGVTGDETRVGLLLPKPQPTEGGFHPVQITDASLLPDYDVFNDMRMALALQANPSAPWFQELRTAFQTQPALRQSFTTTDLPDPEAHLQQMLDSDVSTFTGAGASAFNDEMLKAEALMAVGRYSEAAERYGAAQRLNPANPLALIGQGHALLAAGEYRSAADALLRGIEMYPEIARFHLNLTKLMGGGEIVDIRRADIMDRLDQREVPELRFLLGYLEYHTGMRERGLANLRQAAADPRARGIMLRYPELLSSSTPATPTPTAPAPTTPNSSEGAQ